MNRRLFVASAAAGFAGLGKGQEQSPTPEAFRNLRPMLDGIQPITDEERRARQEKGRRLMREHALDAIVCEAGASMFYYTGTRWNQSEGALVWVLPAGGDEAWIVPEAAGDRARKAIRMGGEARAWKPGAGVSSALAQLLGDRKARRAGLDEHSSFALFDGLRREAPNLELVSADPVTIGCRVIKSPAEIALMQRANDITIAAYQAVFPTMREGMTNHELSANVAAAYRALGVQGDAMAIFGKYTAFPHGSIQPQQLREGDIVLVDDGCTVEGYQSDITRTTVFGKPTARQRQVWNVERRAQDAALAACRPGATCESVDAAARQVLVEAGFGPGYKLPGLPHRTGHGIGLEGHEWTYLVKGNQTRIEPGMCFSDEPTIAIPGEFGIRLEDCMYATETGARMFTRQSAAIDQPFG